MEETLVDADEKKLEDEALVSLKVTTNKIISLIDRLCSEQLSLILQHKDFKNLESSWRALQLVIDTRSYSNNVLIKVLPLNWDELSKDLNLASEVKRTLLYRLIVNNELNTLGGHPFGVLLIDYDVSDQEYIETDFDDLYTLQLLSEIGKVGLCPVILDINPLFWGVTPERLLFDHDRLIRINESDDLSSWRLLRSQSSAIFLGLVMNPFRLRDPYINHFTGFVFNQDDHENSMVWGGASYAFIASIINEFERTSWFGFLRGGTKRDDDALVLIGAKKEWIQPKFRLLSCHDSFWSNLGVIPILSSFLTGQGMITSNKSVYNGFSDPEKNQVNLMLQTNLIGCRFSHYIKLLAREYVGSHYTLGEIESKLNAWIEKYVSAIDYGDDNIMATYPLYSAEIKLNKVDNEMAYRCDISLSPQYQSESIKGFWKIQTGVGIEDE
ncbi:type VI secretion system contractile sheath large subunit [uncultured Shewanella sp.]|uniref:type VI secretion system contractile sheath domain-containing protein n=1 Tax=uncultured Shewanella sp. TaxID=173975 RepID=UPI00262FF74B|nr:type VI secretion system contractile sheath large subunit [uncultured Shewanella sp.]